MTRKTVRRWRRKSHPFEIAYRIWNRFKYKRSSRSEAILMHRKQMDEALHNWSLHQARVLACRMCIALELPALVLYPWIFKPVPITDPLLTWDGTKNV